MPHYTSEAPHQPKGDHNRRLSLGMDPDRFAAEAGITTEQLRDYERTGPDHDYDPAVAERIAATLDRLERHHANLQTGRSETGGHDAPVIDHSRHPPLMIHELTEENLNGAMIYGDRNQEIGKVSHLHGTGPSAQVVIEVGGFLGIGRKLVSVNMATLEFMRDENGHVHAATDWTEADLERMPEHKHH